VKPVTSAGVELLTIFYSTKLAKYNWDPRCLLAAGSRKRQLIHPTALNKKKVL
jgi:hypothetical protein